MFVLLVILFATMIIPPRILFTLIIIQRFYKGKQRANRIKRNNRIIAINTLAAVFNMDKVRDLFLRPEDNSAWPSGIFNTAQLQKTITDGIRSRLSLEFDEKTLFIRCRSPLELLNFICSCEAKLIIAPGVTDVKKKVRGKRSVLKGFLLNIPSEYYSFLYPLLPSIKPVAKQST